MVLAFFSPDGRYDADFISNYTNVQVLSTINRINGANQASIFGVPEYAMRIWLKPDRMAQLGITDHRHRRTSVKQQNQQFAVGRIGDTPTPYPVPQTFPVTTGTITEPAQFDNMILRAQNEDAALVRVKDVGYAELGAQSYALRTSYQGKPATLIAVYQQPGANAIQVSKDVRATLAELSKSFPDGLEYEVALDTTHVRAGVDRRGRQDLLRGRGAGGAGGLRLPAQPAADHHPDAGGAGVDPRRTDRHAALRLLDQHADPVRHDPGHRPGGGRRHRGGREHRAQHGPVRPVARRTPPSGRWTR